MKIFWIKKLSLFSGYAFDFGNSTPIPGEIKFTSPLIDGKVSLFAKIPLYTGKTHLNLGIFIAHATVSFDILICVPSNIIKINSSFDINITDTISLKSLHINIPDIPAAPDRESLLKSYLKDRFDLDVPPIDHGLQLWR